MKKKVIKKPTLRKSAPYRHHGAEWEKTFAFGIILLGTGVAFMAWVNKVLGVTFIAVGGILMFVGAKKKVESSKR